MSHMQLTCYIMYRLGKPCVRRPRGLVNFRKLLVIPSSDNQYLVNGHVESLYDKQSGQWSEPIFVKDPYLRIHGLTPALNYGNETTLQTSLQYL